MNTYIVKQKDINSRMKSRSGGVFAAVSDAVLEEGGVIYGCALDEEFHAYHRKAETKEERDLFRGSKYVQSDMKDAMKQAMEDLKDGRTVLFSGTPCQIAGMKAMPGGISGQVIMYRYCVSRRTKPGCLGFL